MAHLTFDPYPPEHPGTTRAGEVGFYTVVGCAAVGALLLIGIYWLAMDGLASLASFTPGI